MKSHGFILGLHAQTSVHAGAGSATGVIDLPIQREGHSGWPCLYGSAVKGALRARAELEWSRSDVKTTTLFGPNTDNASDHAGALMIGDARLLLLPVRSLTSQFRWLTCPAALHRFATDYKRFCKGEIDLPEEITNLRDSKDECCALVAGGGSTTLFLEEYRFNARSLDLNPLIEKLAGLMHRSDNTAPSLKNQLAIVSNDMFSHIAYHATPVNAHIALDSETKTVKQGALWYEETLPPETVLYSGIHAVKGRQSRATDSGRADMDADTVGMTFRSLFQEEAWLQIGGNETVGMGWFNVQTMES